MQLAKVVRLYFHLLMLFLRNKDIKNISEYEDTKLILSYASSKASNEQQIKNSGKNFIILRLGSVWVLNRYN